MQKITPWERNKSLEIKEIPYIFDPIYITIKYKTNYILFYFWIGGFMIIEGLFSILLCYLDSSIIKYGYTWYVQEYGGGWPWN